MIEVMQGWFTPSGFGQGGDTGLIAVSWFASFGIVLAVISLLAVLLPAVKSRKVSLQACLLLMLYVGCWSWAITFYDQVERFDFAQGVAGVICGIGAVIVTVTDYSRRRRLTTV